MDIPGSAEILRARGDGLRFADYLQDFDGSLASIDSLCSFARVLLKFSWAIVIRLFARYGQQKRESLTRVERGREGKELQRIRKADIMIARLYDRYTTLFLF